VNPSQTAMATNPTSESEIRYMVMLPSLLIDRFGATRQEIDMRQARTAARSDARRPALREEILRLRLPSDSRFPD
jgi:hypothetical protein